MKRYLFFILVITLMFSQVLVFAQEADLSATMDTNVVGSILPRLPLLFFASVTIISSLICRKERRPKMDNENMNIMLGTKWFTFFTKVRPWMACISVGMALTDCVENMDLYSSYWWLTVSLCLSSVVAILNVLVFLKSKGNYISFARFVKGVLIFEVVVAAYQAAVQQHLQNPLDANAVWVPFVVVLVVGYLVWFIPNNKYFANRIKRKGWESVENVSTNTSGEKDISHKGSNQIPKDRVFDRQCDEKMMQNAEGSAALEGDGKSITSSSFLEAVANASSHEDAVEQWAEYQAKKIVEEMLANSRTQPDNEDDDDFGLVPEKPIFTFGLMSVEGEKQYLNQLRTINGDKIQYKRCGSMFVEGINGLVDVYDTFLLSGELYKTIYINMYGAKRSESVPKGFRFAHEKRVPIMKRNVCIPIGGAVGGKDNVRNKCVSFTNMLAIVLTIISMLSIIIAMNVQDALRNDLENWNTTIVYCVLLFVFGVFLVLGICLRKKNEFKLITCLSLFMVLATIIVVAEGSVFSAGNYYTGSLTYIPYSGEELVNILNHIWVICTFCTFGSALVPVIVAIINKVSGVWHRSVYYRRKCYAHVAQIYAYFEKGIISKEEYERAKRDMLKNIDN